MPLGELSVIQTTDAVSDDATGSVTFMCHHAERIAIRLMSSNGDADFTVKYRMTAAETTDATIWTVNNATATGRTLVIGSYIQPYSITLAWSGNTGNVQAFAYLGGDLR
tara:strand:+ start:221 stop:547 length:327 start_codon:yes stop_codon:yes gene_type:complete